MHMISSLFIIISFNSIDCDVPVHYIFVIDSMYCFIRIYVTLIINMYTLSLK